MLDLITPEWDAPDNVRAVIVTRNGGNSEPPWDSANLGLNTGDDAAVVSANREQLREQLALLRDPLWLNQFHSTTVVQADECLHSVEADASWTRVSGVPCAVLMADCMPVFICDRVGSAVAIAHAGWRGLSAGIVRATIAALGPDSSELLVHLGPAIGPERFEVGPDVRTAFLDHALSASHHAAILDHFFERDGHLFADLQGLAAAELYTLGVRTVTRSPWCTYSNPQSFYSYRRDGVTGRNAALIWLDS